MKNIIGLQSKTKKLLAWMSTSVTMLILFTILQEVFIFNPGQKQNLDYPRAINQYDLFMAITPLVLAIMFALLIFLFRVLRKYDILNEGIKIEKIRKWTLISLVGLTICFFIQYEIVTSVVFPEFSLQSDYHDYGGWFRNSMQFYAGIIMLDVLLLVPMSITYYKLAIDLRKKGLMFDGLLKSDLFDKNNIEQMSFTQRATKVIAGLTKRNIEEARRISEILDYEIVQVGLEEKSPKSLKLLKMLSKKTKVLWGVLCGLSVVCITLISILLYLCFRNNAGHEFSTMGLIPPFIIIIIVLLSFIVFVFASKLAENSDKLFTALYAKSYFAQDIFREYGIQHSIQYAGIKSIKRIKSEYEDYVNADSNALQGIQDKDHFHIFFLNYKLENEGLVLVPISPVNNIVLYNLKGIVSREYSLVDSEKFDENNFKVSWNASNIHEIMKNLEIASINFDMQGVLTKVELAKAKSDLKELTISLCLVLMLFIIQMEKTNEK